jgi:hypothetical protein
MKESREIVIFGMGETAHLAYEYFTHDSDYQAERPKTRQKSRTNETEARDITEEPPQTPPFCLFFVQS